MKDNDFTDIDPFYDEIEELEQLTEEEIEEIAKNVKGLFKTSEASSTAVDSETFKSDLYGDEDDIAR